jgi:hypothetical protein
VIRQHLSLGAPRDYSTSPRLSDVSQEVVQMVLAGLIGAIFILVVIRLARRQRLSFRYTIGWLMLALVALCAGLLVPLVAPVADTLQVSPAALLSIVAMILLMAICVQLSISISGLQEQVRRLTEESAELRMMIEETKPDLK